MRNSEVKQRLESILEKIINDGLHQVTSLVNLGALIINIGNPRLEAPQNSQRALELLELSVEFLLSQPIFTVGEEALQRDNHIYFVRFLLDQFNIAYQTGSATLDLQGIVSTDDVSSSHQVTPSTEVIAIPVIEATSAQNSESAFYFFLSCLGCFEYILPHNTHYDGSI